MAKSKETLESLEEELLELQRKIQDKKDEELQSKTASIFDALTQVAEEIDVETALKSVVSWVVKNNAVKQLEEMVTADLLSQRQAAKLWFAAQLKKPMPCADLEKKFSETFPSLTMSSFTRGRGHHISKDESGRNYLLS